MITLKEFGQLAVLIIALALLLFGLNYAGVIGERFIFENSFQYQEARDLEISNYEAQLVEIETQLRRTDLTAGTRKNLEAQAAAIRVRIKAAKARQK